MTTCHKFLIPCDMKEQIMYGLFLSLLIFINKISVFSKSCYEYVHVYKCNVYKQHVNVLKIKLFYDKRNTYKNI
jgi:hypothetical protein